MQNRVLSAGAIQMTFKILKRHHPTLALTIRNILKGSRNNRESFEISLPDSVITEVCAHIQKDILLINDTGMLVIAQALLEDWKSLLENEKNS